MVSHISAQSATSLFSLQIAAPVFAFLATQEVLYQLFEKAMLDSSQDPHHASGKGRIGAVAIAGGILAGASIVMPSSTILYLTIGTISCLALLAFRFTREPTQIIATESAPTPAVPAPTLPSTTPKTDPNPALASPSIVPAQPVLTPASVLSAFPVVSPKPTAQAYQPVKSVEGYAGLRRSRIWENIEEETRAFFGPLGPDFFVDEQHLPDTRSIVRSTAVHWDETHYLHANWVGVGLTKRPLVAASYPTHYRRFDNTLLTSQEQFNEVQSRRNFWNFAYDHNALIIDLHQPIQDQKCLYYPTNSLSNQTLCLGDGDSMTVRYFRPEEDITIYWVSRQTGSQKMIERYAFPLWKDGNVISVPALTALVEKIRNYQLADARSYPPTRQTLMIHCRSGLGRTGTLIAALIVKEKIESGEITSQNLHYYLVQIVVTIRVQRHPSMIQNLIQFQLLYDYAASLLKPPTTEPMQPNALPPELKSKSA